MDAKDLTAKFDAVGQELEQFKTKHNEELKNIGSVHGETKGAIEKLTADFEAKGAKLDELQKSYNELDVKMQRMNEAASARERKHWQVEVAKAIKEKAAEISAMRSKTGSMVLHSEPVNTNSFLLQKAADMTTANVSTGDVVVPDFRPGIARDPIANTLRVRQLVNVASTGSDSVRYIEETAYDDGTASKAQGVALAQSDFDLERKTESVETIGAFSRITEEALDDIQQVQSYIATSLVEYYGRKEDQQLLYGTALTNQLRGVTTVAAAYVSTTALNADTNLNHWDVLARAVEELASTHRYSASGILVAPAAYRSLVMVKDADGHYIYPGTVRENGTLSVLGVPVFQSTAIDADDFLVGDWRMVGSIYDRRGVLVELSREDATNFTTRQVTIRAYARLCAVWNHPNAMRFGGFANALGGNASV